MVIALLDFEFEEKHFTGLVHVTLKLETLTDVKNDQYGNLRGKTYVFSFVLYWKISGYCIHRHNYGYASGVITH